ncbi:MAG: hypothetical protein OER04_08980 [Cyclobacteriaceae bacterium]|nr:hypothetical protein [Cyclobacteriaceae bacterium]
MRIRQILKMLLFPASLLVSLGILAQSQVEITLGPEIKTQKRGTLEDIIGHDESGYYTVRAEPQRFYVEKYGKDLNLLKSEEIELGRGSNRKVLVFAEQLKGEIYLFTSQRDLVTKEKVLYADLIDRKTLKPQQKSKKLAAVSYRNRSNDGFYDYNLSRDSSKLMIFYDSPNNANMEEKFGITVLDDELNPIWDKEVSLPFKDRLYEINRYKVDNQGNAYLLGIVYKGQVRVRRQGRPNYEYHLLAYNKGDTYTEYLLNLDEKFITDMQFDFTPSGDIVCAGFYSEYGTRSIRGTFYLLIDSKTKEVKKEFYQEFEADFLTDFMSERKADKGRELSQYDLNRLEIRRDGGVVLVAEQFYIQETSDYNSLNPYGYPYYSRYGLFRYPYRRYGYGYPYYDSNSDVQYNYNDLMVININPDGSIQWARRIPKRQRSKNDGGAYSSYALSVAKGKLFFVFNDNPKNLHKQSSDLKIHNFTKGKESVVVLVSVDGKGEVKKEPLFQVRDTNTYTKPKVCEQISRDQMIIFSQRNRKTKFAKLNFK